MSGKLHKVPFEEALEMTGFGKYNFLMCVVCSLMIVAMAFESLSVSWLTPPWSSGNINILCQRNLRTISFDLNNFFIPKLYIDNNGLLFLHEVSQQHNLEVITEVLDKYAKSTIGEPYAKWTVGEPCVALYIDDSFYRGRVLEVNNESSSCLVQYVDYGNEEICEFVNMRKSISLHQIPIQAHKCILARIRPIGNQWDRTTLDYIRELIVEKECLVKVGEERVGDHLPIDLKLVVDNLSINDHLADLSMAKYRLHDSGPDYIVEEEDESDSADDIFEDAICEQLL